MIKEVDFQSKLLHVYEVSSGVYALIEKERGIAGSNSGIIDLGNDVIIFDTFLNIDASKEIKKVCEYVIGKNPTYIINSHSHMDHIVGNGLFNDKVKIVSSMETKKEIQKIKKDFDSERNQYKNKEEELSQKLMLEKNETEIANIKNELNFITNLAKPNVEIRVPNLIFNNELILFGSNKKLYLKTYPVGHSLGDTIAILPKEKICFTGDILFQGSHPWIGSGEPEQNIEILEYLLEEDIEYFIPGHGKMASKEDLKKQIRYIKELITLSDKKNNITIEDLAEEFQNWNGVCFPWNIEFLQKRK